MASTAILRSAAARSFRLQQRWLLLARRPVKEGDSLTTRLLSSSVPTEGHKCIPSDPRSRATVEHKRHVNEKKEGIYQRVETKADNISDCLAERQSRLLDELEGLLKEQSRLLQKLEVQIKNNNKHS